MSRIAGIDVHKKMLAAVMADVEVKGEYQFERRQFGSTPDHLRLLAEWLIKQKVEEVVQPPDLPPVPLMDMGFAVTCQLARHRRPHIRFFFIGSRLCSTLLSGPASRRVSFHPCALLSLHLHQFGKRTFISKLSNMSY